MKYVKIFILGRGFLLTSVLQKFSINPSVWVYATGSTEARVRLYRMGINKYYDKVSEDFEIYGLIEDEWLAFNQELDFEAFVVRRIKK